MGLQLEYFARRQCSISSFLRWISQNNSLLEFDTLAS
jgi:hypothetical protein